MFLFIPFIPLITVFSVSLLGAWYLEYKRVTGDYTSYSGARDMSRWSLLGGIIIIPVIEELIFRGYILGTFGEYDAVMNVLLFSGMHAFNWVIHKRVTHAVLQVYMTAYLGFFCYQLQVHFACILYPMMCHILWNGIMLLVIRVIQRNLSPEKVFALKLDYVLDYNPFFFDCTTDDNGVSSSTRVKVTHANDTFRKQAFSSILRTKRYDSWNNAWIPCCARG